MSQQARRERNSLNNGPVRTWDLHALHVEPHAPQILTSSDAARAIVLFVPAGDALQEHQVHERAWLTIVRGEVEIVSPGGDATIAREGSLCEFEPNERHEVRARRDSRLLLLLTPWPGAGHPGAMTLEGKASVRRRAREHDPLPDEPA